MIKINASPMREESSNAASSNFVWTPPSEDVILFPAYLRAIPLLLPFCTFRKQKYYLLFKTILFN